MVQAAAVAEAPTRALLRAVGGGAADGRWMRRWRRACWTRTRRTRCCGSAIRCCAKQPTGMLTGPGRRRLHRAIGAALADPDQAAWHLARGADEPDETLAAARRAGRPARQRARRTSPRRGAGRARGRTHPGPRQPARVASPHFLAGAAGARRASLSRHGGWARNGRRMSPSVAARAAHRHSARASETDIEAAYGLFAEAFDGAGRA